jgi:hypothetical protein
LQEAITLFQQKSKYYIKLKLFIIIYLLQGKQFWQTCITTYRKWSKKCIYFLINASPPHLDSNEHFVSISNKLPVSKGAFIRLR